MDRERSVNRAEKSVERHQSDGENMETEGASGGVKIARMGQLLQMNRRYRSYTL